MDPTTSSRSPVRRPVRPTLESLEDRSTPATFLVTSLADTGAGTLRQALSDADTSPGADVIQFQGGAATGTIIVGTALSVTSDVAIQGPGAAALTVSGNNQNRVFDISAGTETVSISGITIANGLVSDSDGGGIRNAADLTLSAVVVENNQARSSGSGGGVYNASRLRVVDSKFRLNAVDGGAATNIFSDRGSTLVIDRSEAVSGQATNSASPLTDVYSVIANSSVVTITNATLSGIRISGGTADLRNVTEFGSTISVTTPPSSPPVPPPPLLPSDAAGLSIAGEAAVVLTDSIVFGNRIILDGVPFDRDVGVEGDSIFISQNNIIGWLNGVPTGQDPLLGTFGANGGPTRTAPLLPGSPAIGTGTVAGAPSTDQRGFPRPAGGPIDIGAFQIQIPTGVPDSFSTPFGQPLTVPAAGVLANDLPNDIPLYPLTAILVTPPAASQGMVNLNPNGSFTFTPATGFTGPATFTYRPTNGPRTAAAATTVTVTVGQPLPIPPAPPVVPPPDRVFRYEATGPGTTAARVASGIFTPDGVSDIVIGSGVGLPARVTVIDGSSRQVLADDAPFGTGFTGGVFVAAGDIDGDGIADVAVTADTGGGPRVRVYLTRGNTLALVSDFFALDPSFRGGLRVALGDVNRDGAADLIVTAGPGGGPRVASYDGRSLRPGTIPTRLWNDFFAFEAGSRLGAFVAVGDLNGDGFGDIVVGVDAGGGPRVAAFDGMALAGTGLPVPVANFFSGSDADRGGVRVAVRDIDGNGKVELVTGSGSDTRVRVYDSAAVLSGDLSTPALEVDAFPGLFGGVYVA